MTKTICGSLLAVTLSLAFGAAGCAQSAAAQKASEDAKTKGKYKVRLTTDSESVVGTCKYVMAIEADHDVVAPVSEANLADYFRVQAVSHGADTVVVRGRVGEAYICGPGPLNPDGTLKDQYDSPTPPPR